MMMAAGPSSYAGPPIMGQSHPAIFDQQAYFQFMNIQDSIPSPMGEHQPVVIKEGWVYKRGKRFAVGVGFFETDSNGSQPHT